jgi:SagB-type dehydrogenase family enzyme
MTDDPGLAFLEATAYPDYATTDQLRGAPQPPFELPVPPHKRIFTLPNPETIEVAQVSVRDALEWWEPTGLLHSTTITIDDLSFLLWCTQAVRDLSDGDRVTLRNVPSCSMRHPLETYLVVNGVDGIPEGLYRYLPVSHRLVLLSEEANISIEMSAACMNLPAVHRAAVTFAWTGVPYRATWALGKRGYRCIFLDAGHVCQALVMAAASIGCEVRPIDLFHDALVSRLIGCDGTTEFPVQLAAVGRRESRL